MEFNRSTFLTDSFVDARIIAQIGAGKFLFERILEVVGVAKEFMAVEHSDVGHTEHGSWSKVGCRDVDPGQIRIICDDLPGPSRGVVLCIVGSFDVLIGHRCVVYVNIRFGLVDVHRR